MLEKLLLEIFRRLGKLLFTKKSGIIYDQRYNVTTVLDVDKAKCTQFSPLKVSSSPAEVVEETDVVFTALPMPPHVKAVFEGDSGLLAGMGEGKVNRI